MWNHISLRSCGINQSKISHFILLKKDLEYIYFLGKWGHHHSTVGYSGTVDGYFPQGINHCYIGNLRRNRTAMVQ